MGYRVGGLDCVAARLDVAMTDPGLVVVHLLTHGLLGRAQTVLYVLGPDGARIQPSVGEWLTRAEERGDDCGPVLFILDVCYAGKVVGYQLRSWLMPSASGRGCWPPPAARIQLMTEG